ncbi:MAG TPA: transglycosylase SLT domain-containing protein [Syntrophorhabdaceae bacterium]|nr:transglycosylase SLT domain-containing protein [Syntrophorhabdaceae bacterium]HQM80196.1 transglycosylase SLT domain-containing protein [Syntrophorhabdaceae bacterium]
MRSYQRSAVSGQRSAGSKKSIYALIAAITIISLLIYCTEAGAQATQKKGVASPEKRIGDLEKDVMKLQREVDIFNLDALPENLTLCEKKIPIYREDVRDRFEREFFQLLENKGLLTLIVKRYLQYMNMINEEIRKMALPSDLIYLAITESYLLPRSLSRANAAGIWQFIKETGKREGLLINDHLDERYNIKRSTRSALTHLKRLYGEFGDWLIAMAAYNAGPGRLREAIEHQGTRDFLDLYLPEETERYIFRILAVKEIILNRERYGIKVDEKELYKPLSVVEIVFETDREIHTNMLAKAMELPYRTFRIYNLQIRKYRLPKGTYRINVPAEKKEAFLKGLKGYEYIQIVKDN